VERGRRSSFVPAGDSPDVIRDVPFALERNSFSAAVGVADNQVVVAAHNDRVEETFYPYRDRSSRQFHRSVQIVLIETGPSAASDDPRVVRPSAFFKSTATAYTTRGYLSMLIWPTPPSLDLRAATSLLALSPSQTSKPRGCQQVRIFLSDPVLGPTQNVDHDPWSGVRRCK